MPHFQYSAGLGTAAQRLSSAWLRPESGFIGSGFRSSKCPTRGKFRDRTVPPNYCAASCSRRGFESTQFSVGTFSIVSIFKISTLPRCDSSLKPN